LGITFEDEDGEDISPDDDGTWEEAVEMALLHPKQTLKVTAAAVVAGGRWQEQMEQV
jgi:hypothetical protein